MFGSLRGTRRSVAIIKFIIRVRLNDINVVCDLMRSLKA